MILCIHSHSFTQNVGLGLCKPMQPLVKCCFFLLSKLQSNLTIISLLLMLFLYYTVIIIKDET